MIRMSFYFEPKSAFILCICISRPRSVCRTTKPSVSVEEHLSIEVGECYTFAATFVDTSGLRKMSLACRRLSVVVSTNRRSGYSHCVHNTHSLSFQGPLRRRGSFEIIFNRAGQPPKVYKRLPLLGRHIQSSRKYLRICTSEKRGIIRFS